MIFLALCVTSARAAVSFPGLFGDHAIVQRAEDACVWGRAEPGETVAVALGPASATAVAEPDGWWFARLDTSSLGDGPFDLSATAPSGSAVSHDILVGEVWLAGGQSNVAFTMSSWDAFGAIVGYDERAAACVGRPIRMFRLTNDGATEPVKGDARGRWVVVSPETLGGVTAVGYTFIDTLQRSIGGAAGVVDISVAGTRCWAWLPRETLDAYPELKAERLRQEAAAVNGETVRKPVEFCWDNRFHPVSRMRCRGIVWYQGEDDSSQRNVVMFYPRWFAAMVSDMRRAAGRPDLPFLYCQVAGWGAMPTTPSDNPGPANLREAQRLVRRAIHNSAMAVTLDNSEYEIHGRLKGPVGDRLAALALNKVYGRADVPCESPDLLLAESRATDALLTFANGGAPLAAGPIRTEYTWNAHSNDTIRIERRSSPSSQLEGFTICGGDGVWRWADAEIVGPDTVRVWADGARNPVAVRYAWGGQGFGNLVNEAGFPASPFAATAVPRSGIETAGAAASPYGICAHLTAGERDERPSTFAAVQTVGAGMVRCDFWWSGIERADGSFDFSLTDAVVADAKAAGITILPILGNGHPKHGAPFEDEAPWRRYVRAVAKRYAGDCPVFEVWNEPNHRQNGKSCQNPTNYVAVLKAAAEEIRTAAPGARIAFGGTSGAATPALAYIGAVLALGGGDFFDIVNVHAYCIPSAPEYHYAGTGSFARRLRALMATFGYADKPIWNTEFGWPTNETDPEWPTDDKEFLNGKVGVNEASQAAWLARALGCAFAEGVEVMMPYELRDCGGSPFDRENRFGLLREDFSPKPAFAAYRTFTTMRPAGSAQKEGAYFEGGSDGLFFPQWRRPDGASAGMLWLGKGTERRTLRFAGDIPRFFDHLGHEILPGDSTSEGGVALDLSGNPVYFLGAELAPPALAAPEPLRPL